MSNWHYLNCRLVPFLWAGVLLRRPGPSAARRRARARGVRAVVLRRHGRRPPCASTVIAPNSPPAWTRCPSAPRCCPLLFEHAEDQRLHRQPDARLGLLHRREGHVGAAGVRRRAQLPDHLPRLPAPRADPARARPVRRALVHAGGRLPPSSASRSPTRPARRSGARSGPPSGRRPSRGSATCSTWAMPAEARPIIPARYQRVFAAGALEIYARAALTRPSSAVFLLSPRTEKDPGRPARE